MKKFSGPISIIIGIVAVVSLTTLIDAAMYGLRIFPTLGNPLSDRQALVALGYRIVIGLLGGYLTARLSTRQPLKHSLILGTVGFVVGGLGALTLGDKAPGPVWYGVAVAVLALPQCWLGALIYLQLQKQRKLQVKKNE